MSPIVGIMLILAMEVVVVAHVIEETGPHHKPTGHVSQASQDRPDSTRNEGVGSNPGCSFACLTWTSPIAPLPKADNMTP